MTTYYEKNRAAAGLFLIGLAALALLDWWMSGVVVLCGGVGLFRYTSAPARRVAWALLGIGGIMSLWEGMLWAGLEAWFPFVMVVAGAGLLATVDLTPTRPDVDDNQSIL